MKLRGHNSEISRGFFRHHQRVVKNDPKPCLGWTTMDCGCTCGHLAVHFAGWIHRIDPPLAAVASFTEDNEVPKCSKLYSKPLEFGGIYQHFRTLSLGARRFHEYASLKKPFRSAFIDQITLEIFLKHPLSWSYIHWVGMSVYSPFCPLRG